MSKMVVLALLAPEDADAAPFRQEIEGDPALAARVELRFAARDAAQEAIADAEVVVCGILPPDLLAAAQRLRWVSFWSAGLDTKLRPDILARDLRITNASGVHGPNIAEHVLAFMLMFTRRMPHYLRAQIAGQWQRTPSPDFNTEMAGELTGQTLGIVGLGHIGEDLARRAQAFDMRVIATKRDPAARPENAARLDALLPPERLTDLLAASDHVCIALPYTPQTHHLFDATLLARMKPSAYLYNIARGKIVDEAALIAALQAGRLAGAGLDVFETEPLPPDSPLWKMENVIITPHVAGITPHYFPRAAALFTANLRRYLAGQPLANLYDPKRGY
ncbi:MAG TPA: D-2-hydroxyacid dehydrogenase [Chthonomonadaceae bacterium]|nr:D-2-hydroxyacid dehydrogenase [Chthonomonadaceae bacterium]